MFPPGSVPERGAGGGVSSRGGTDLAATVRRAAFGSTPAGEPVESYTFASAAGIEVCVLTLGAIVQALRTPDRGGAVDDIVLGHDDAAGYFASGAYFGAVVGRYGNRIAHGRFTLDGVEYQLARNDGPHHLHGGPLGFDKAVWQAHAFVEEDARGVRLSHRSPAGDQGYPGTLDASVTYTLTDDDELVVEYEATSDHATPVNLTQHSYFNLAGAGTGDVLDHELAIHATHYTPVDAALIPTGELALVAGTPFDFRRPTRIGARIDADDVQLQRGRGYDHNFVLSRPDAGLAFVARVAEPRSGRVLEVHTTEPGMQLYTGNFLHDGVAGKAGRRYGHRSGLCLETQHFPDSPNQPHFPSTILRPGAEYRSRTVFAFSTIDDGESGK
jgi:aldose 1-epimerase